MKPIIREGGQSKILPLLQQKKQCKATSPLFEVDGPAVGRSSYVFVPCRPVVQRKLYGAWDATSVVGFISWLTKDFKRLDRGAKPANVIRQTDAWHLTLDNYIHAHARLSMLSVR